MNPASTIKKVVPIMAAMVVMAVPQAAVAGVGGAPATSAVTHNAAPRNNRLLEPASGKDVDMAAWLGAVCH